MKHMLTARSGLKARGNLVLIRDGIVTGATHDGRVRKIVLAPLFILAVVAGSRPVLASAQQDSAAVAEFKARVADYVKLHRRLEAKHPKETSSEQIARSQSNLAAAIQSARASAKRGDIFTPRMTRHVRQVLTRILSGARARQLRASIRDEYPGNLTLVVNASYPSTAPIASTPPDVLAALPPLPEELEFRFVGEQLILFDRHAHIVVDFILNALPGG